MAVQSMPLLFFLLAFALVLELVRDLGVLPFFILVHGGQDTRSGSGSGRGIFRASCRAALRRLESGSTNGGLQTVLQGLRLGCLGCGLSVILAGLHFDGLARLLGCLVENNHHSTRRLVT